MTTLRGGLRESVQAHDVPLALAVGYAALGLLAVALIPGASVVEALPRFAGAAGLVLGFLPAVLMLRLLQIMIVWRPAKLVATIMEDARAHLRRGAVFKRFLPVFIGTVMVMGTFSTLKPLIPVVVPFSWDVAFMDLDRAIYGGMDPWRLLQPVLGYPRVTWALNMVYHAWFFVMYLVWVWQALQGRDEQTRQQFLSAFILIWAVLGTLGAFALSSAGPCYFGALVGGPDPFAPLMAYLRDVDRIHELPALDVQQMLLEGHLGNGHDLGISAMPSMHVASSVLFALVAWRMSRALGIALWVFAILILVGSVHLGWHYAVDGYAGFIGAIALWRVAGWLLRVRSAAVATPAPAALTNS